MCKDGSLHCFLVDYRHILLGQEVESVKVCRVCLNVKILLWLFDIHNRFKQNSRAFLDKLTHRMKIGGEDCRGRIDSFVILTFTFTKQLFVPFIHHGKCRFIGHHDFNCFSFAVKDVSQCRISVTIVLFQITDSKCFSCFCCTVCNSVWISEPETAIGSSPTAVSTEYLPPTSSGITKVS